MVLKRVPQTRVLSGLLVALLCTWGSGDLGDAWATRGQGGPGGIGAGGAIRERGSTGRVRGRKTSLDPSGAHVRLYVYHRDYQPGGVRSVIESQLWALKQHFSGFEAFAIGNIRHAERHSALPSIPSGNHLHVEAPHRFESHQGTQPEFRTRGEFERAATIIADEMLQRMEISQGLGVPPQTQPGLTFFMPHNPSLISPATAHAVRKIAEYFREHKIPGGVLIQPHDFPTENRSQNLRRFLAPFGQTREGGAGGVTDESFGLAGQMIFGAPAALAVINKRDHKDMVELVGLPPEQVFYLPDTIDARAVAQPVSGEEVRRVVNEAARQHPETFDAQRKTMLLPVRLARKKNVKESLLTLVMFNGLVEASALGSSRVGVAAGAATPYQMLVTVDATEGNDGIYAQQVKDLATQLNLPLTVGFMAEHADQVVPDGKGRSALFSAADVIDVSSVMEGFGLSTGEGSLSKNLVIGRKLEVYDWEGVSTHHMRQSLHVPLDGRFRAVVNGAELRGLYVDRLGRARDAAGLASGGGEIESEFYEVKMGGPTRRIDFADLSDAQQDRIIALAHTDAEANAELISANPKVYQSYRMAESAHRGRASWWGDGRLKRLLGWFVNPKVMWQVGRLIEGNQRGFASNYGDEATAQRLRGMLVEVAKANETGGFGTGGSGTGGLSDAEAASAMQRLVGKYYGLAASRLLLLPE